jgi:hypothetical protein
MRIVVVVSTPLEAFRKGILILVPLIWHASTCIWFGWNCLIHDGVEKE